MVAWKKNQQHGFTLVELLVTITIFTILTGVVLFSQSKFNSSVLLTNLAYDTALTIRQAQNYGINVKEFTGGSGGKFLPYGVHFDKKESSKSFILFADLNYVEGVLTLTPYDGVLGSCDGRVGCVNRYNIPGGNKISDICVVQSGSETCTPVDVLDILFQRPNPDARIYAKTVNTATNYDISDAARAIITVSSADGSTSRDVVIQANGLIQIGKDL